MINGPRGFSEASHLNWESLYLLIDRAPFGVYIVDEDFRISLVNAESQQRAFRNVNPAVGRDFSEAMRILWPEDVAAFVIEKFHRTLATGESFYSEDYIHPRADIDIVEAYEWEVHRIVMPDGKNGLLCYYYDTTKLRQTEQALRKYDTWLHGQKEAFRTSINGAPLETSLDILIRSAIEYAGGDTRAAFYLMNSAGTAINHITGMTEEYAELTRDFAIGPDTIGCGRAAFLCEPVICENVDLDPAWVPFLSLAYQFDYRATWSFPIQGVDGKVVGTFCVFSPHPRAITARDMEIANTLTNAAAVIMSNHQVAQARAQAEKALRKSEERKAFLLKLSDALRALADPTEIQFKAMQVLGEHLGVLRAQYYEAEPNDEWLTSAGGYTNGVPAVVQRILMDDFGAHVKTSFRAGRTLVVNDVSCDPRISESEVASYNEIGVAAYVGIPLVKADRFVAALAIHSATPREWTEEEIVLTEETAQRTWAAVEHARAEAALRNANRRKDEFLALLAHELRNPLAAVRNTGQILLRSNGDPKVLRSSAETLNRQVDHMVRQVDDLLDVSRIATGKIELRKENIELATVVAQAIEAHRSLCDRQEQTLTASVPLKPIYIYGDPIRLAQVIGNLINNASKFTAVGGRIELTIEQRNESAIIRIKDSGVGIAASDLNQIFEMFVQADQSLERCHQGLGLGLALVKSLVEMHDGKVEARSEGIGHGSEFVIQLPISTAVIEQPAVVTKEPQPANVYRRVLVADDNHDSAMSLATLLNLMGYETQVAHDGIDAIEKAAAFQADVVLLDISMPRLNGYDAARRIRAAPPKDELKLVALTGFGQAEDRRRTQEAGFDAHLTKPVDLAVLTKVLAEL
jgi:signal transduction histidine kinase